jgi:hypothetical protein
MIFNDHSALAGQHAFLSASKYHWINYDEAKLEQSYTAALAAKRGTQLHQLAHDLIIQGVNLPKNGSTLSRYVNDGIGWRMKPEVMLFYSPNCFGTVDAISFRNNTLRISDLKTGITPTKFQQLEVYAAMFCLEYDVKPFNIKIELRIYQNNETRFFPGDPDEITHIMSTIVAFDKKIAAIRSEVLG